MSTPFFDIFKKFLPYFPNKCSIILYSIAPSSDGSSDGSGKENICSGFGNLGKNRRFVMGRTKN